MSIKKEAMKTNKKLKICFLSAFSSIHLYACSKGCIKQEFQSELNASNSLNFTTVDSIIKGSMIFIVPDSMNNFLSRLINSDIDQTTTDNDYDNAAITYNIMKSTNSLVSIVKSVYKEADGAPRGFFAWDECLNYLQFANKVYMVRYDFDSDYSLQIKYLQESGELDLGCTNAGLKEKPDLSFFLYNTNLFLHDPIASPFCNIDLKLDVDPEKISFTILDD